MKDGDHMEGNGEEFAWVDTETSGLDPQQHRVLEIAVVVTDQDLNDVDVFESKIKLSPGDRAAATPKALEVNGYNDAEWADAPPSSRELWSRVQSMTTRRNFAGQNPLFDEGFLRAELGRWGLKGYWFRRLLDTQSFGQIIGRSHNLRNANNVITNSLVPIYDALGGPKLPEHRAMGDVRRSIFVYDHFRRMYEDARSTGLSAQLTKTAFQKLASQVQST